MTKVFRFLILIPLLLAGHDFAVGNPAPQIKYDYNQPGFWRRRTPATPQPNGECLIHISVADPPTTHELVRRHLAGVGAKNLSDTPSRITQIFLEHNKAVPMKWAVPVDKVESVAQYILALGKVERFFPNQADKKSPPGIEEYEYKSRELLKEKILLEQDASKIPGILGLLDAQIETVQNVLAGQRQGNGMTILVLTISRGGTP